MKKPNAEVDVRELTDRDFARAIPRRQRERRLHGRIAGGADIIALHRFVGLTQQQFAEALGMSVHTLRDWEQGRRTPEGPALALLPVAARHPRVLRENLGGPALSATRRQHRGIPRSVTAVESYGADTFCGTPSTLRIRQKEP
jgi:DNA-binding transcriptional regulator YiaG